MRGVPAALEEFSVLGLLYRRKQDDFKEKIRDMINPSIVYVTDLVMCSHKRIMRRLFPLLSFRFEPALVLGDLVHAGLEKLLGEEGWEAEVEVQKEYIIDGDVYTVKGRADLVKRDEEGNVECVVEIKTGRDLPEGRPHQHHIDQLAIYMELLDARCGLLVYVTPERLLEFNVPRSGFDIRARLEETVRDGARPRFEWECRYCPFRRVCPFSGAR
jgi:CRISPR-associated exonuclease Cas4